MAERFGIWLKRLAAGLAGALALAAAAYVPVVQLLPKQVVLEKEYLFLFDADAFVSTWPEFSRQQRKMLAERSEKPDSNLPPLLTVEADPRRPVLKIRCVTIQNSAAEAEFYHFLDACTYSFSQANLAVKGTSEDRLCAADRMYLTELREKQQRLQGELAELERRYQPLDLETFSLERRLDPAFGREQSAFQTWIQPFLDQAYASDESLDTLGKQHQQVRQEIARLDQQAGRSETESGLDDVKQRRERMVLESQTIQDALEQRQNILQGQIRDQQWPLYQKHLENQIEENHRALALYACNRNVLKTTLEQVDKNLQSLQPLLLGPADASAKMTAGSSLLSSVQSPVVKTETLSSAQMAAVLLAAGAGMILGLILASFRYRPAVPADLGTATDLDPLPADPRSGKSAGNESGQADSGDSPVELVRISIQQELSSGEHTSRDGRWSERYDHLADLLQPLCKEISCPVILLSAIDSAEASPRVAVNLGIALARRECRVLLIESDAERNDLADIFDVPAEPGFADWLGGRMDADNVLLHQPLDHLFFLPAGSRTQTKAETEPETPENRHLWTKLRKRFDLILLYSPGALSGKAGPCGDDESLNRIVHAALTMARSGGDLKKRKRRIDAQLQSRRITHLGLIALQ